MTLAADLGASFDPAASDDPRSQGAADGRRPLARAAALLLLGQFAAMWGAFLVLMPAIDWPASLDEPASIMLPMILDEAGPVFAGYASYLLHALLLIPLAVLLRHTLRMGPALGGVAVALGALAGLAKALGITRWLFLMPGLAAAYVDPAGTEASRAAVSAVFDAFNAYAGGVGEILGVGLFAGLWTALLSLALIRMGGGARVLGWLGLVAALGLLSTLPSVLGWELPVLLTLSGILWQFWTAAVAVWHLRAPLKGASMTRPHAPKAPRVGMTLTGPGKRLTLTRVAPDALAFEEEVAPDAPPVPLHLHLRQSERLTVLSGILDATVDGTRLRLGPGETVLVPPGAPHAYGNADARAVLRVEVRLDPPLDGHRVFEGVHGMAREGRLPPRGLRDALALAALAHRHGFDLGGLPLAVQRPPMALGAGLASRLGAPAWSEAHAADAPPTPDAPPHPPLPPRTLP